MVVHGGSLGPAPARSIDVSQGNAARSENQRLHYLLFVRCETHQTQSSWRRSQGGLQPSFWRRCEGAERMRSFVDERIGAPGLGCGGAKASQTRSS